MTLQFVGKLFFGRVRELDEVFRQGHTGGAYFVDLPNDHLMTGMQTAWTVVCFGQQQCDPRLDVLESPALLSC